MKKKNKKRPKSPHRDAIWTPWEQCDYIRDYSGPDKPIPPDTLILLNNHYQVQIQLTKAEPFGRVAWLSIKRRDRKPIHDWRDLQRIKNEIVGEEVEAVELYPAESRHVDTSNQYHLWAFIDGYQLPFGYQERLIIEPYKDNEGRPDWDKSLQRPFRGHMRPKDALTPEEAHERFADDPNFGTRLKGTDNHDKSI